MSLLIDGLKSKCSEANQRRVARNIGISESLLSMILHQHRQLSRQTLTAIVKAYPELSPQVSLFLLEEVLIRNEEGPIGNADDLVHSV